MTSKTFKNAIGYTAIIILLFSFAGIGFANSGNSIRVAKESERQSGKIKGQYKHQKGPAAHAPAHGYRAKYKYHYYPRSKVYYDTEKGVYFYLKGTTWEVGITLPSRLQKDLGKFVSLELDTDRPYLYNEEHNERYASKKTNLEKKQTNFFTKLWVLLFAK